MTESVSGPVVQVFGQFMGPESQLARVVAPLAVTTEPKAEKRMFGSDLPIAELIIRVSSVPDAPTRVPATTSTTE